MVKKSAPFTERNIMNIKLNIHKVPEFKEIRGKEWIQYGQDPEGEFNNRYPDFLIQCFNRSAKNNAIITGVANYVYGQGWTVDKLEDAEMAAEIEGKLENINSHETADDLLRQVALDQKIFGGFYLEIIWEKGGKKWAEINHIDYNHLRSNFDGTKFFYTKNWEKARPELNEDFKEFDAFDVNKPKGSQILYVKEYRPGVSVYALPDYIGCIPYIECDYSIANFHRNNIENGFWGGYALNFPMTVPDEEIQKSISDKFTMKHTGSDNAGRVVITFSDGPEGAPTLLNLQPSDLDKQFDILNKTVQQEIFTGHKITSGMLFGIKTEGQLGGRTELLEAWEHFYKTYVQYKQQIIERVFNKLFQVNGLPPVLKIKPIEPIGIIWSENTYVSVMTKDELREKLGLPKLDLQPSFAPTQMSSQLSEKEIAEQFIKECAVPKCDIEKRVSCTGRNFKEAQEQAQQLLKFSFGTATIDQNIVNILVKNPNISEADIAKALTISEADVKAVIKRLKEDGTLKVQSGEWKVKPKAVDTNNPFNEKLKVMYDYVKRPIADGPVIIETTRDFCRAVLSANSFFDAQKIQQFSDRLGYDVFDRAGGWWTHNGEHDPQCRHEWNLVVVKVNQ